MSETVLADAQFSMGRVFRPFSGFESVYEGVSVNTPIAIPGTLDPNAGEPGYDPNLLAGIPMPMGSKALIWFPTIFNESAVSGLEIQPYRYSILWRLRNLRDFRGGRNPYHLPFQSLGEGNQFVVPCGVNTIVGESFFLSQNTAILNANVNEKRVSESEVGIETLSFKSGVAFTPLTPNGSTAAYQQGLAQGLVGSNKSVTFNPVQVDVLGDEMIILIDRPVGSSDTWSFEFADSGLSAFFGTAGGTRQLIRSMGIYVFTGSNP